MKVYILGKLGKLNNSEYLQRINNAAVLQMHGNDPLNFADGATISFDDPILQLMSEISLLLQADAVCLLNDFNNCDDARLLLLIAIRRQLLIKPAKNCVVPARISFTLDI